MMNFIDMRARFEAIAAAGAVSGVGLERFWAGGTAFEAIRLEPERFWDDRDSRGFLVMVLDGVGSIHLDDWRSSVSGGHLVEVPSNVRVRFVADGRMSLAILVMRPFGTGEPRPGLPQEVPTTVE